MGSNQQAPSTESANRFSIDKKLISILSVFAFAGVLLVVITLVATETLSTLQSYSILQSHWTEMRKDAMGSLEIYVATGSPEYLDRYREQMTVLEGLGEVRTELRSSEINHQQVTARLIPLGFAGDEIESMITASQRFGGLYEFSEAFKLWNTKDDQLAKLRELVVELESGQGPVPGTVMERDRWLGRIEEIEQSVTALHYKLSGVLAQGTHRLESVIFWSAISVGLILLLVGGFMAWRFLKSMHRWRHELLTKNHQIKAQLEERTVLLEEIHHRVKNNLAFVSSLLMLNEDEVEDPQARQKLREAQSQIIAIAEIHEIFYDTENFSGLSLKKYARQIFDRIFGMHEDEVDYRVGGDHISLTVNQAIPAGLILNELATNSCKHAFGQKEKGEVMLKVLCTDHTVQVAYEDDGQGLAADFDLEQMAESSLGMRLIYTFLQQLDAEYELDTGAGGFGLKFSFPIK